MTTNQDDKSTANPAAGFLKNAFKAGMGAAETMHRTAVDIPLTILQQMGVEEEKISGLRTKSNELINELYVAIDSVAAKSGVVGGERSSDDISPDKDEDSDK